MHEGRFSSRFAVVWRTCCLRAPRSNRLWIPRRRAHQGMGNERMAVCAIGFGIPRHAQYNARLARSPP